MRAVARTGSAGLALGCDPPDRRLAPVVVHHPQRAGATPPVDRLVGMSAPAAQALGRWLAPDVTGT